MSHVTQNIQTKLPHHFLFLHLILVPCAASHITIAQIDFIFIISKNNAKWTGVALVWDSVPLPTNVCKFSTALYLSICYIHRNQGCSMELSLHFILASCRKKNIHRGHKITHSLLNFHGPLNLLLKIIIPLCLILSPSLMTSLKSCLIFPQAYMPLLLTGSEKRSSEKSGELCIQLEMHFISCL